MLRTLTLLLFAAWVIVAITFGLFGSLPSASARSRTAGPPRSERIAPPRPSTDPAVDAWRSLSLGL